MRHLYLPRRRRFYPSLLFRPLHYLPFKASRRDDILPAGLARHSVEGGGGSALGAHRMAGHRPGEDGCDVGANGGHGYQPACRC